ncbi:GNAT family N-acetyltransferase [Terasakiella sp.]|uniref:GNAT family N-acetyltransferase n=1 Tax=Terasakiella sp. TaxID=2034861 RepID=UPI003AA89104
MSKAQDFNLLTGYQPGLIGRTAALHGRAYVEKWKFWKFFECKVASEHSMFMECYDEETSCIWSLEKEDEFYGTITLDGSHAEKDGAHLRWFILHEEAKGKGLGKLLLKSVVDFAKTKGYESIYLWTLAGLEPAGQLYRRFGFTLEESKLDTQWGVEVQEEKLRLKL